ncbi:MAG: cytosine permease [Thaumarchaeota archaeon]|nr:cytosine permease [Nitrososphaerota archaeon]
MPERPGFEKAGIEHIPEERRHGSAGSLFTLWFAANLTVADYVVGVITVQDFHLTFAQAVPVLLLGNVLGGLALGLSAAMGPKLGFPQMMSSRGSFGRKGNYVFGGLNWLSTVGWFTVNTILGVYALQVVWPWANYYAVAVVLVSLQALVAIYGHDFIHLFEKVMAVVLGVMFLGVFVAALDAGRGLVPLAPTLAGLSLGSVGVVLATSFSYLMSWSPYASDYSRYLPSSVSGRRVALFALIGGGAASFAVELIGALVGELTPGMGLFQGLYGLTGTFGPFAIAAILLGAAAANSLNIYTNSLSALVLDVRAKRWVTVIAGGAVGLALAVLGAANFVANFESFLLVLDYWITPWLGVVLVDYFVLRRTTAERVANPLGWDLRALAAYAVAMLVSVPFMVPAFPLGFPFGALAYLFGGADFSYFVSFAAAFLLAYAFRGAGRNH